MDPPCSSSEPSLTQPSHYHTIVRPNPSHTSSDLPATISLIQDLTILAESTLKSISDFLSLTPSSSSSAAGHLSRCPFDSRHLMPPESLFRHFLTCSSAPGSPLLDLGFLDNLQYPKSLKSEDQLLKENPRFQRVNEYISTSIRASQERAKCPNYRALLEHDGLLWQRPNNQVLHDIIEEHMEEIKLAGGIGCNVKMASESTVVPKFEFERNKDLELQCSSNDAYDARINKSLHYAGSLTERTHEYDSYNDESSTSCLRKAHQEARYELYEDWHKFEKSKQEMPNYRSRSPSYHSSYSHSSERYSQQMDRKNWRPARDKFDGRGSNYPPSYKDYDSRSTMTSKSQEATRYEYNGTLESRRRYDSRASEKQWTDSSRHDMFEDRYEPSRSYDSSDTFYEGTSGGSHHLRPQKPSSLKKDIEHHDAQQRSSPHISGHNQDHYK